MKKAHRDPGYINRNIEPRMWKVSIKHCFGQVTRIAQCRVIIWVMACDGSLSHEGVVDLDSK